MCVPILAHDRIAELARKAFQDFEATPAPLPKEYAELASDLLSLVFVQLRVPLVSSDASAACSDILKKVQRLQDGPTKFQSLYYHIKLSEHPMVPNLLRFPEFSAQATQAWALQVARRVLVGPLVALSAESTSCGCGGSCCVVPRPMPPPAAFTRVPTRT